MLKISKVKRELDRLRQQLWAVLGFFYEPLVQKYHDIFFSERVIIHDGKIFETEKIAIFLIYQPNEIPLSIVETCKHFLKNGYSTILVSNGNLTKYFLPILKEVTWKIVERPNYGYDFGGYRDAIKLLSIWNVNPKLLVIINDSIWWPLYPDDQALIKLESMSAQVAGAQLFTPIDKKNRHGDGFIESYFYFLKEKAIESIEFKNYWKNYKISSNKYNAVHNGERKFSKALLKAGLVQNCLNNVEQFSAKIENAEAEFMFKTLQYGVFPNRSMELRRDTLLNEYSASEEWLAHAKKLIYNTIREKNFNASFIYCTINSMDAKYIKKNNTYLYKKGKSTFVDAVNAKDLKEPFKYILKEISESI